MICCHRLVNKDINLTSNNFTVYSILKPLLCNVCCWTPAHGWVTWQDADVTDNEHRSVIKGDVDSRNHPRPFIYRVKCSILDNSVWVALETKSPSSIEYIAVTSHECHGISNHRQFDVLFTRLLRLHVAKIPNSRTSSVLCQHWIHTIAPVPAKQPKKHMGK